MATVISNQASATYSFEGSSETRNTVSNIANTTVLDDYSLEITKESILENFTPGENITYVMTITNNGTQPLTDFILTDNLGMLDVGNYPLSYVPNTARLIYNGQITTITPSTTEPLSFLISNTLAVKQSFIVTYIAKVDETIPASLVSIINDVDVSAASAIDPANTTRYTATDSFTLQRLAEANLEITKQVSKSSIYPNDSYDYILTVSNTGIVDATNVIIQDALPEGFIIDTITVTSDSGTITYNPSEYDISSTNVLTLPNSTGARIDVRGIEAGVDNTTTITISGTYSNTNIQP